MSEETTRERRVDPSPASNADTRMILDALSALTITLQATQDLGSAQPVPPPGHNPHLQAHIRREATLMERVLAFFAPIAMIAGVYMTMHDDILIQKQQQANIKTEIAGFKEDVAKQITRCEKLNTKVNNIEDDVDSLIISNSTLYKMIQKK